MQLKTEKPAHRGFASLSYIFEGFIKLLKKTFAKISISQNISSMGASIFFSLIRVN
jgi:hypothetical protein